MDRFLIAPLRTGLQTDLPKWQLMDDAFSNLQNAYVFRGRVRKRFSTSLMGSTNFESPLLSRLRIQVGTTNGAGDLSGTVPGAVFGIGQNFSVGAEVMTVTVTGTPAVMVTNGTSTTHTYNTTTGAFVIAGAAANTAVFFYPSQPVMGIDQYEVGAINNHPTYAFDTQFAYVYTSGTGWARSGTGVAPQWNGQVDTNYLNFFWVCNWKGTNANITTMYVTNFQVTNLNGAGAATDDPIWFTSDGTTWISIKTAATNGFYFLPNGGARTSSPFVVTARIIVAFKNRLVLLNTVENNNSGGFGAGTNSNYPQRARFSWNGSPLANQAWYEPNQVDATGTFAAGAGFIDAATDEQIISCEFIKDRLVVYFERSTWELAYTGNEQQPFIWNKLNTELGSQGTFSTVPFDKQALTVGNTGLHSCNGSNVERIDEKIPDYVFDIKVKNNESKRICGVRDFEIEMVYWAVPIENASAFQKFNNQVLVYNYKNNSWALNDDCFTAFGYLEQSSDITWASSAPATWASTGGATWVSGFENAQQRQILAGTPSGFVLIIDSDNSSGARNAPAMSVTNVVIPSATYGDPFIDIVSINHNFLANEYVAIENVLASGITATNTIYQVYAVLDANTFIIYDPDHTITGTYLGGATLARVSNIMIQSKRWNPYDKDGRNVYLHKIDFAVQKTSFGEITVDYYPSSSFEPILPAAQATGSIMGNGILETFPYDPIYYPLEQLQELLWHPVYFQTQGESISIFMYFTPEQITDTNIAWENFELEGLTLYTQKTSSRME